MEAIILAGGFGTRLSHIVKDVPKPMAPVNGEPFLKYIFDYLLQFKTEHVVLALGYKADTIMNYFGSAYKGIQITNSLEGMPLGTGGAIKKAMGLCRGTDIFVLNGDTYFDVDLYKMNAFHKSKKSRLTVAVKPMDNFDRYGTVFIENDKIIRFEEKKPTRQGRINGGTYLVRREIFDSIPSTTFSFEKEMLENKDTGLYAYISDGYFIDIGIPDDYARAQKEFEKIF